MIWYAAFRQGIASLADIFFVYINLCIIAPYEFVAVDILSDCLIDCWTVSILEFTNSIRILYDMKTWTESFVRVWRNGCASFPTKMLRNIIVIWMERVKLGLDVTVAITISATCANKQKSQFFGQ